MSETAKFLLVDTKVLPEVFSKVVYAKKLLAQGKAANLSDAAKLAEYFDKGEIDRIYLNFSDPWPKSRHAKRRLTAPGFLAVYREILKEGGYIRQKTDNVLLFESSLESYAECGWRCEDICRDLHNSPWAEENILTEYEINFSGKGLTINAVTAYRD